MALFFSLLQFWGKSTFVGHLKGVASNWCRLCYQHSYTHYRPVPWAQDSSMSFLVPPALFRSDITSAGFDIKVWNDKTDHARKAFINAKEPVGEPNLPILGVYLLVGDAWRS